MEMGGLLLASLFRRRYETFLASTATAGGSGSGGSGGSGAALLMPTGVERLFVSRRQLPDHFPLRAAGQPTMPELIWLLFPELLQPKVPRCWDPFFSY